MPYSRTVHLCAIEVWFHHRIRIGTSRGGAQASGRPRHSTCDYAPQPGFKCCVPMNYTYGSSICPLSGNPKSWVEESQDFLYFFKPKFCSKICFYSQQKCVNYLRKTNARDDLCSKINALHMSLFLQRSLFWSCCCWLVGRERSMRHTHPRGPLTHVGQMEMYVDSRK